MQSSPTFQTAPASPGPALDQVLNSANDCIQILDLDGRIEFLNSAGLRKWGILDLRSVRGLSWLGFWSEGNVPQAKQAFQAAVNGHSSKFTGALADAGNSPVFWEVTASPIRDAEGKVTQVLVVCRDASEQARVNADHQLAEDRFQLFVESVKDYALFLLDPAGNVTTWNEGAKRIKGYEAGEIIGKHFSTFYTPEDVARKHPQEELEIAEREGKFEEEGWRVRKDGSRFWASVVISRVRDRSGTLVGFAKVTRDLTERRAAEMARLEEQNARDREQLLEQIFSESPAFMTLLSVPDFRFLKSNEEHLRLVRKREVIGKTVRELRPEMEDQGLLDLLKKVAETGEPFVGRDVKIHYEASEGEPARTAYLDFVYQPLRRPDGVVYAIAVQGYDVTAKVLGHKAVENERENFRHLFRQTPEMVCILKGPEHVFEFVNEAHVKVLGFDATGMPVRVAQPESVEVHGILDEVYRTGNTALLKKIPVTVAGRLRYFNLTYSARRNEAGMIDGIMILGTEITDQVESSKKLEDLVAERTQELRESESFLDSVIENIPNMVFVKDAKDLRFVRFNRAGEELLGLPRSELLGKSDYDFFPREQAEHFVGKDREALADGSILDIREEVIETKDKGRRFLHTRKIPIRGMDGTPEYLLGISEDITEWKLAEEKRVRVIREQAAVEERKKENDRAAFLAEASTILASSLCYRNTLGDLARLTVPTMADWCSVTMLGEDGALERLAAVHRDPLKMQLLGELAAYSRVWDENSEIGQVIKTRAPRYSPEVDQQRLVAAAKDSRHLDLMRQLGCTSCIIVPIVARNRALGAISLISDNPSRRYNENDLAVAIELGRRAGIAIENASLYESLQQAVRTRDEFLSIASHELEDAPHVAEAASADPRP